MSNREAAPWLVVVDMQVVFADQASPWATPGIAALVPVVNQLIDDRPGQPVVSRTTFGKWDSELAGLVGAPADLVLVGVSTDCCVLSTALAAADAGARVRVVADACAGVTRADHERGLQTMALHAPLIELTDADSVRRGR